MITVTTLYNLYLQKSIIKCLFVCSKLMGLRLTSQSFMIWYYIVYKLHIRIQPLSPIPFNYESFFMRFHST